MDKIYSRPRIKIPKVKGGKQGSNKDVGKIYFMAIMLIISVATGYRILKSMDPIFEGLCVSKAQSIATDITNRKASEVLAKYDYNDTVQIIKSEDGKNSILKTDIVKVNQIVSDISIEIQKELDELCKQDIEIPVGALLGNQYFAGFGPHFKIKIISSRKFNYRHKNRIQSSRDKSDSI